MTEMYITHNLQIGWDRDNEFVNHRNIDILHHSWTLWKCAYWRSNLIEMNDDDKHLEWRTFSLHCWQVVRTSTNTLMIKTSTVALLYFTRKWSITSKTGNNYYYAPISINCYNFDISSTFLGFVNSSDLSRIKQLEENCLVFHAQLIMMLWYFSFCF